MEFLHKKVHQSAFNKTKSLLAQRKCGNKRKRVSINVEAKKIKIDQSIEKEERSSSAIHGETTPLVLTPCNKRVVDTFIEDPQVKKTLGNWRQMIQRVKVDQSPREIARLEIEQMRETVCLNENIEAMHDFRKLIGGACGCPE
ncbi:hypothetical protein TSUD_18390 [Trifolium subterraneum]|uniref:Uncharacterized protein n=1 Tax=Trifolium subterraneum TaxID=3900 RepID=A0A2Z6NFK1_TRISU|nr:hypothetical protein TSUD_18390 [Trifolium subterraneum]